MAPRANWKGVLKLGALDCPVALYTAASTAERIAFHTLNRATGHRLHRDFVDGETGEPVAAEDQVKGYETAPGRYVAIEPDEIAAAMPAGDKILEIEAFIPCGGIDEIYLDRPYYLAPSGATAGEAFAVLREGMRRGKVAALARGILFRRVRTLLIRPQEAGLIAATLKFDYEVRASAEAFSAIPERKIAGEMLDLAKHIIQTKRGSFDPKRFDDRYEAAVVELVAAKRDGRKIQPRKAPAATPSDDLLAALRQSAAADKKPARRRKAG
jgi:DNA end-binding protein Ku